MTKKPYIEVNGKQLDPTEWSTTKIVDAIGELHTKIARMNKNKSILREILEKREGIGTHTGKKYQVKLAESISYEYDNLALYKALKKDKFIQCTKPVIAKVKTYIAPNDLQSMILQTMKSIKIYVKELNTKK